MKRLQLAGKRFGRLIVVSCAGSDGIQTLWNCLCDCGNTHVVKCRHLINTNVRSCGCLQLETIKAVGKANTRHGECKPIPTVEYISYKSMLNRCYNVNDPNYRNYGARGISVCNRWRKSYPNFLADMGRKPSLKHSLDRINNNGNYKPSNCRWATSVEQNRNQRDNRLLVFNGVTRCVTEWIEELNLPAAAIQNRLRRGWSVERTLTEPVRIYERKNYV